MLRSIKAFLTAYYYASRLPNNVAVRAQTRALLVLGRRLSTRMSQKRPIISVGRLGTTGPLKQGDFFSLLSCLTDLPLTPRKGNLFMQPTRLPRSSNGPITPLWATTPDPVMPGQDKKRESLKFATNACTYERIILSCCSIALVRQPQQLTFAVLLLLLLLGGSAAISRRVCRGGTGDKEVEGGPWHGTSSQERTSSSD